MASIPGEATRWSAEAFDFASQRSSCSQLAKRLTVNDLVQLDYSIATSAAAIWLSSYRCLVRGVSEPFNPSFGTISLASKEQT
jgi:hypothetical protein